MAILPSEVRLYKSEVQNDTDANGGRMSPNQVVDGEMNNLFPNISRMDHAKGQIQMRKGFMKINSDNTDEYAGAHMIIQNPPVDPDVQLVMFNTDDHNDIQSDIVETINNTGKRKIYGMAKLGADVVVGSTSFNVASNDLKFIQSVYITNTANDKKDFWRDGGVENTNLPDFFVNWIVDSSHYYIYTGRKTIEGQSSYSINLELAVIENTLEIWARRKNTWEKYIIGNPANPTSANDNMVGMIDSTSAYYNIEGSRLDMTFNFIPDIETDIIVKYKASSNGRLVTRFIYPLEHGLIHISDFTFTLQVFPYISNIEDPTETLTFTLQVDGKTFICSDTNYTATIDRTTGVINVFFPYRRIVRGWDISYKHDDPVQKEFNGLDPYAFNAGGLIKLIEEGDVIVVHDDTNEDMCLVTKVDGNEIHFYQALASAYSAGAKVSVALNKEILQASVSNLYDQETWDGTTWTDERPENIDPAAGTYNDTTHPVVVTNLGAETERWAIKVKSLSPDQCDVIGEHVGTILENAPMTSDIAPINPNTNAPYFTLAANGWGASWQVNNVLRFNTTGAQAPVWLARLIQAGVSSTATDNAKVEIRGDVVSVI